MNDSASVKKLIKNASDSLGAVVGVVNNASLFVLDRIEDVSEEAWVEHMKVNALAPLLLIQTLFESSVEGSWVVNILDFKVESPNADYLSYTGSRFALHGLTSALALDLAPKVRINSVAPGHVLTSDILDAESLNRV